MPIHTLTLGKEPLKKKHYRLIKDTLFGLNQSKEAEIDYYKKHYLQARLPTLRGITLKLSNKIVPRLELTLNPAIMLGGNYSELCDLTDEKLSKIFYSAACLLATVGANFSVSSMSLTRLDCTKDVTLHGDSSVEDVIGCLKRNRLGRGYELVTFAPTCPNSVEKNRHSFRAACKDVSLTVYDKSFQLNEEGLMAPEDIPQNRMRVEVAFENASFQRVLRDHLEATVLDLSLEEKIMYFSNLSVKLIQQYLRIVVMPGRFMRYDAAKAEIEKSRYSPAVKESMVWLLKKVRRHYKAGLDWVIQGCKLTRGQLDYLLKCFRDLDLNPVSLPTSSQNLEFPSIDRMLEERLPV